MKKLMFGGCGVAAMAAMALLAQDAAPKTINVVGLEDDKDNAQVVASAELATKPAVEKPAETAVKPEAKPETVTISANALAEAAAAEQEKLRTVNTATVKSLTVEGTVIPPSAEDVKTLEEAVRNILVQAKKQVGCVSSNGIEKLTMPYQQLGDGKSFEIEWRKALRHLLTPVGYNFTEDSELVLFGLAQEVDEKHKQLAQERLASNRTPILFTTNEAEGGMELRNAIRDISIKADVTISTDYMEPADLYVPVQAAAAEGNLTAADIGNAQQKAAAQQTTVKRTTFDTNGQQIEWRIVLREILNPHDYDFVEVGGVVRIAKRAKLAEWEQQVLAQKPLAAKVIRVYHADPEAVVERVKQIKGILKHPNASLQASRKKDEKTETVKNLNARLETSSGKRMGQSETTSQVFDQLTRPRTVPAIIAYDIEENIAAIEDAVKLFDIKEKQVLIEAIIFELDNNNGEGGELDGFKWLINGASDGTASFSPFLGSWGNAAEAAKGYISTFTKTVDVPAVLDAEGNVVQPATTREVSYNKWKGHNLRHGNKMWLHSGYLDFQVVMQMIRAKENSKLLSSPMLVVGDHTEAAIQVAQATPIPDLDSNVIGTGANGGAYATQSVQWNILRTGVLMWVAPEITEDGHSVRLTVHPQVTEKGEQITFPIEGGNGALGNSVPYNYEFTIHEMDTRATVPSGSTLMFGGLVKNSEVEIEEKVRWLGDIPVLGWFFRSKTKMLVQKNLVIMIRPTILEDDDQTGFEERALEEAKSVGVNSGRNLRSVPMEGPYSVKKTKQNIEEFVEERVIKPFRDEDEEAETRSESSEAKPAEAPQEEAKQE